MASGPESYNCTVASEGEITEILLRWNRGEAEALNELMSVVYKELQVMAQALLNGERVGHTLSATALVHEAYLKLLNQHRVGWEQRAHFFGAAGRVMRRVLIDHARKRAAGKREASSAPVEPSGTSAFLEEVLSIDAALDELEAIDPRKARVVELKFFAGMTNREIARAIDTSEATVERDWTMARAWMIQALNGRDGELGLSALSQQQGGDSGSGES